MERTLRCPICREMVAWEDNPHRPFCSERCQLLDLGSWATERYRIAAPSPDPDVSDEDDSTEGDS